jgi:peptide/nickel transport system substrate-binding protein
MYQARFSSSTTGTWMQNEWLQDKTLDTMIDDSLGTLDQTQRYAKYSKIQQYLMDLAPTLMVFDQFYKHGYRTCIDWPAARGETSKLNGYMQYAAGISVNCP